jgi:hypothetical protein
LPFATFNVDESLTALSKILTEHEGSKAVAVVQLFPSLVAIAVAAIAVAAIAGRNIVRHKINISKY